MGELTIQVTNGPDSFFGSTAVYLWWRGNGAMWFIRSGRGVGRKGRVSCHGFQLISWKWKIEMGELTTQVSNGPDSFFGSTAVYLWWRGDGAMWFIRSGRGVGRKERVSTLKDQLNSWKWENQNGRTHHPGDQWAWFFFWQQGWLSVMTRQRDDVVH
jgi:predicted acetyltransferase